MAQKRRKEQQMKRQQRQLTMLCIVGGIGAMVLSLVCCLLIFGMGGQEKPILSPQVTPLPYDAEQPFGISDLTASQLSQLRTQGRLSVSDGPRGISIGDTLETLLDRFPANYAGDQPADEQILYCADYFENQNGVMTVLPPRGMLRSDNREITVTLLSPTSTYPSGTLSAYSSFEHIFCIFGIEPDTMTVSRITLGID